MKFTCCLSVLFFVPIISLSDSNTNGTPENPAQTEMPAPDVVETNQSEAMMQTNVLGAAESEVEAESVPADSGLETHAVAPPAKETFSIPKLTYFVHQEDTGVRGSAFLLQDTNGVWLVSNSHVFSGSTNLALINIEGKTLKVPARIETAKDRDIIRFLTYEPRGLGLSPDCKYDETIYAYGDSGGAGVLTKLEGKAVALGPDRIEISASIIPGNSGGPVVNTNNEVVGVSTYLLRQSGLPDWIVDGTRFTDTRRMALKLNDIEWVPVDFAEFYKETIALGALEDTLYDAISITAILSDDFTTTIIGSPENRQLQSWIKTHNRYAKKDTESSRRSLRRNIGHLASFLEHMEENPTPDCDITIPFLKERLHDILEACESTRKHAEALAN